MINGSSICCSQASAVFRSCRTGLLVDLVMLRDGVGVCEVLDSDCVPRTAHVSNGSDKTSSSLGSMCQGISCGEVLCSCLL